MDFLNDPRYIALISFLQRNYPPAATAQDADEFLTTAEIYHALTESFTLDFTLEDLSLILLQLNYETTSIGTLKCVWMIKSIKHA